MLAWDFATTMEDALEESGWGEVLVEGAAWRGRSGYRQRPFRYRGPGRLSGRVWMRNGEAVVVADTFAPSRSAGVAGQADMQKEFEEALERFIDDLESAVQRLGPRRTRLVMQGGGMLRIPQALLDRLKKLGVELVVISPESARPLESLADALTPREEPREQRRRD